MTNSRSFSSKTHGAPRAASVIAVVISATSSARFPFLPSTCKVFSVVSSRFSLMRTSALSPATAYVPVGRIAPSPGHAFPTPITQSRDERSSRIT
jgi:hypothetical protein